MDVGIVGSYRKSAKWDLRNKAQFRTFCDALGRELGHAGHFLVLPTDKDTETADFHCLTGFRKAVKGNRERWKTMDGGETEGRLARGHIDAASVAQLIIAVGGGDGTYAAGMTAIRHRTILLPVSAFGSASEILLQKMNLPTTNMLQTALFQSFQTKPEVDQAAQSIVAEINGHPRIMIAHGRSSDREVLKDILQNHFEELHEAQILDSAAGDSLQAISTSFAKIAENCTGAIVIATPDDIGTTVMDGDGNVLLAPNILAFQARARENVWLELGWLWAHLTRDRVMLLLKGETQVPSDIVGLKYVHYSESPEEVRDKIEGFVSELKHMPSKGI